MNISIWRTMSISSCFFWPHVALVSLSMQDLVQGQWRGAEAPATDDLEDCSDWEVALLQHLDFQGISWYNWRTYYHLMTLRPGEGGLAFSLHAPPLWLLTCHCFSCSRLLAFLQLFILGFLVANPESKSRVLFLPQSTRNRDGLLRKRKGLSEMVQWVKIPVSKPDDLSSGVQDPHCGKRKLTLQLSFDHIDTMAYTQ